VYCIVESVVYLAVVYLCYISMNLARQLEPLFKDAHNFFRFRRGFSTVQHNRGEIRPTVIQEQKAVGSDLSDLSVLGPVRHFYPCFIVF
jgi:hypothetical protein